MTVRLKNRSTGFTIVETMLVLAIAGIMLVITFGAVPALQRNSRNGQRKQEVQSVLEAVSHWELNHSGNMPDSGSNFLQYADIKGYDKTHVSYISDGDSAVSSGINVYIQKPTTNPATERNTNTETVDVYNYRKCDPTAQGSSTNRGAGFSDVVALYAIETRTASAPQCQQL